MAGGKQRYFPSLVVSFWLLLPNDHLLFGHDWWALLSWPKLYTHSLTHTDLTAHASHHSYQNQAARVQLPCMHVCACSSCLSVQSIIPRCNKNANTTIFLFCPRLTLSNEHIDVFVHVFVCGPVLNRDQQRLHIWTWLHTRCIISRFCRACYEIIQFQPIC